MLPRRHDVALMQVKPAADLAPVAAILRARANPGSAKGRYEKQAGTVGWGTFDSRAGRPCQQRSSWQVQIVTGAKRMEASIVQLLYKT